MTNAEAHQILDRVKNGIWHSEREIKEALFITGDLRPDRFAPGDSCAVSVYARSRSMANQGAYERQFGPLWKHSNGCESED